ANIIINNNDPDENPVIIPVQLTVTPTPAQVGDLNHDNRITPADAAIALQLAATGAHNPAADMNDDGRITSLDALMILKVADDGGSADRMRIQTMDVMT
ncbi:MAG: dockerin type I domain-containing protein, partial [Euryarchaeota archaeon]|nr:dockerin type I domain-containing protein [Euryarchaeota archaeon]